MHLEKYISLGLEFGNIEACTKYGEQRFTWVRIRHVMSREKNQMASEAHVREDFLNHEEYISIYAVVACTSCFINSLALLTLMQILREERKKASRGKTPLVSPTASHVALTARCGGATHTPTTCLWQKQIKSLPSIYKNCVR